MFGIFGGKPKDKPPNCVREVKKFIERLGQARGGEIIRDGALSGNVFRQILLYQAGLFIPAESRNDKIQHDLEVFTEITARHGLREAKDSLRNLEVFDFQILQRRIKWVLSQGDWLFSI